MPASDASWQNCKRVMAKSMANAWTAWSEPCAPTWLSVLPAKLAVEALGFGRGFPRLPPLPLFGRLRKLNRGEAGKSPAVWSGAERAGVL